MVPLSNALDFSVRRARAIIVDSTFAHIYTITQQEAPSAIAVIADCTACRSTIGYLFSRYSL